MTTYRRLTCSLLACLALTLGACSSGDDTSTDDTSTEEPTGDATTTTETTDDTSGGETDAGDETDPGDETEEVDVDPCTASAAFDEAFPGDEFDDPTELTGEQSVNDVKWTNAGCIWASPTQEVRVTAAGPDDFEDGFVCVEPLDGIAEVEPVADLGDQAWWSWNDFQNGTGTLTVCSGESRVDITVAGPRDGEPIDADGARSGATVVADALL